MTNMVKFVKYGGSKTNSFQYCRKWKTTMYSKYSSRQQKAAKMSPQTSPPGEVIKRRVRGRMRRARADRVQDLFDITDDVQHVSKGKRGLAVVITDSGLDKSSEDCAPDFNKIMSGPAHPITHKKLYAYQHPCATCLKLYQTAKRAQNVNVLKDKLLDNDPKSLTCDQWVLLKKLTHRRALTRRGNFLNRLRFDQQVDVTREEQSGCSRPHPFLQRNLRRVKTSANQGRREKNQMKRPRADPLESRAAKHQRLRCQSDGQHVSIITMEDSPSSCQETEHQADANLSVELTSPCLTPQTPKPREAPYEKKPSRQCRGFRELLAQLRGSTIIRETQ